MIYRSAWCIEDRQNHESSHDVTRMTRDQRAVLRGSRRIVSAPVRIRGRRAERSAPEQRTRRGTTLRNRGRADGPRSGMLRYDELVNFTRRGQNLSVLFSRVLFSQLLPGNSGRPEMTAFMHTGTTARRRLLPLPWSTSTWTFEVPHTSLACVRKRVHANSRASVQTHEESWIAFLYDWLRHFKSGDSIVYLIINFRINYHLENASLPFIRFLFHVRDR